MNDAPQSQDPTPTSDLATPSRFWQRLGHEHEVTLRAHGPVDVKRRQALRYFTWAWRAGEIRHKEQFRFLVRHTSIGTWLRSALEPVDLRASRWAPLPWSLLDRFLYVFAVRLLWAYALDAGDPETMRLAEPLIGNPPPVRARGRLISQDIANSAMEVEAIRRVLRGRRPRHILEIGAGYGRTAYVLLSLFPEAKYTVLDIPPAIDISRWYLSQLFPPERLSFVVPDEIDTIEPSSVDLAVSISSFQEMTRRQIGAYVAFLDQVAAGGCVFLKQWDGWYNADDDVCLRVDDYPIPGRWHRVLHESSPIQTMFRQAGWVVPRNESPGDLPERDGVRGSAASGSP